MTQYLISFEDGAMDITEEELPKVADEAHAVVQEAKDAGVLVFTGGLDYRQKHALVDTDGLVTDGPYPESKELIGGLFVVDVPTFDDALKWAAKVAVACHCAQDVREFFPFRRTDI
ncbi:YciI family protein [Kribbella soli]